VLPVGAGSMPGVCGVGSGVRTLCFGRVEVHMILCISTVYADSFRCYFGKEGSRTFGYDEALPGVFVSQPSPCYAQETQHPTSSILGPRRMVSE